MYAPSYDMVEALRRPLLIALTCVTMSLSACGDMTVDRPQSGVENAAADHAIDASSSARGKLGACSQITKEEVEAALGRPLTEPARGNELVSRKSGMLTSSCMFVSDQSFVSLNVRQQDPESTTAWNAAESYEELKGLIFKKEGGESPVRLEEVAGLGADAFAETMEETANYQTTALRVLTKRTILTIRVNGPTSTPTLEAATMLAGKALSRLERDEGNAVAPRPDRAARPATPEKSQTARDRAGGAESAPARKVGKEAPARDGQGLSRAAREPSAKVGRKAASRTAERGKKETQKTSRSNPKNRKRR